MWESHKCSFEVSAGCRLETYWRGTRKRGVRVPAKRLVPKGEAVGCLTRVAVEETLCHVSLF